MIGLGAGETPPTGQWKTSFLPQMLCPLLLQPVIAPCWGMRTNAIYRLFFCFWSSFRTRHLMHDACLLPRRSTCTSGISKALSSPPLSLPPSLLPFFMSSSAGCGLCLLLFHACSRFSKTATEVVWSLGWWWGGVYVATSFQEINLLQVMESGGKHPHKAAKKITCI